jgi:hypothetical protein
LPNPHLLARAAAARGRAVQPAELLGVTHRAARLNIDKLVEAGVLAEVGNRQRNKLFLAVGVLATVEGLPDAEMHRTPTSRES